MLALIKLVEDLVGGEPFPGVQIYIVAPIAARTELLVFMHSGDPVAVN